MRIFWNGYYYGTSGYSISGRGLLKSLSNLCTEIQLKQVGHKVNDEKPPNITIVKKLNEEINSKPQLVVHHRIPNKFRRIGYFNIGMTYWETTKIPKEWVNKCNEMDQIILFSEMNRIAFKESGVKVPIVVLPSGISSINNSNMLPKLSIKDIFNEKEVYSEASFRKSKRLFTFLSISQWLPRKGFDILIRAFCEEFSHSHDVQLLIKTKKTKSKSVKEIYAEVNEITKKVGNNPPIIVYAGELTDRQMIQLYQMSDAYVLPTRGEGVGLPFLEAGRAGLPVIATGWGGQTDFLNKQNSYLIDYTFTRAQKTISCPFYEVDQYWAEPDKEHLKFLMRRIYESSSEAKEKGKILKQEIAANHQWEKIALKFLNNIRLL